MLRKKKKKMLRKWLVRRANDPATYEETIAKRITQFDRQNECVVVCHGPTILSPSPTVHPIHPPVSARKKERRRVTRMGFVHYIFRCGSGVEKSFFQGSENRKDKNARLDNRYTEG